MIFEDLNSSHEIDKNIKRSRPISQQERSHLMVKADNPKHLNKLDELKCDVATINLEDGIFDKKKAKELCKIFLSNLQNSYSKIAIRVNELEHGGFEEIEELSFLKPDAFRIPKIRTQDELNSVLEIAPKESDIYLTIETKEAFTNIKSFKDKRVKFLYFGVLDLLSDLELPQSMVDFENENMKYMMSRFVVESRAIGGKPISFTFQDYKDTKSYTRWCEISKRVGFSGQSCIAPNQVEIANSTFLFSNSQKERALYIKEIFEEKQKEGVSGFADEKYGFIDEPIYKDACLILGKLESH